MCIIKYMKSFLQKNPAVHLWLALYISAFAIGILPMAFSADILLGAFNDSPLDSNLGQSVFFLILPILSQILASIFYVFILVRERKWQQLHTIGLALYMWPIISIFTNAKGIFIYLFISVLFTLPLRALMGIILPQSTDKWIIDSFELAVFLNIFIFLLLGLRLLTLYFRWRTNGTEK